MDKENRQLQHKILNIFAKKTKTFALTGGTALELYYLYHRFSVDLDFFSPIYDVKEINEIVKEFKKETRLNIKLESEFIAPNMAKVRFYSVPIKSTKRSLKLDFVEDVIFDKPKIKYFDGVPVYDVKIIYLQKITTITGLSIKENDVGAEIMEGRRKARDVFDIYMLSKKIEPLHLFLKTLPRQIQRGMIYWYQTFSRQDLKFDLLDMDIYIKNFDSREMIIYLENEVKKFMAEEIE
ncbi:MAG: nucleotidyl transferase AbiEii/AbiGii toxin family protein [Candidatus Omnitrophota bacterium]